MVYFISDTHFGHRNIIDFCRRPFADVNEMREQIINAINSTVKEKDELWHLGDFGLHMRTEDVKEHLKRLVCNNVKLILGNHDENQHAQCFNECYQAKVIKWNHQRFYLSHYPLRAWREHFQLHGHEHGRMQPLVGQLDVGVDGSSGFNSRQPFGKPWSVEEVIEYVQRRDKDRLVADACKREHGSRIVVGGYGSSSEGDGGVAG